MKDEGKNRQRQGRILFCLSPFALPVTGQCSPGYVGNFFTLVPSCRQLPVA